MWFVLTLLAEQHRRCNWSHIAAIVAYIHRVMPTVTLPDLDVVDMHRGKQIMRCRCSMRQFQTPHFLIPWLPVTSGALAGCINKDCLEQPEVQTWSQSPQQRSQREKTRGLRQQVPRKSRKRKPTDGHQTDISA